VRMSQASNDSNSLTFESTKVNDAYKGLKVNVEEKIRNLEDRYAQQQRSYRQLETQTKSTYEQAKAEHDQEIADLTREYNSRLEISESTLNSMLDMRDGTEEDFKSLNIAFMQE
jgi:chromosome segregation ATPase